MRRQVLDELENEDDEVVTRRSRSGARRRPLSRWREDREIERPRTGARRTVMSSIRLIPSYLKLLLGLVRDRRVSRIDRLLVLGAAAYVIMPIDFIPDLIPFFGQVDDIFLVMASLQRLVDRAGDDVVLDHWDGHPRDLSDLNLARIVASAGFFLPSRIRRRLRRMAR